MPPKKGEKKVEKAEAETTKKPGKKLSTKQTRPRGQVPDQGSQQGSEQEYASDQEYEPYQGSDQEYAPNKSFAAASNGYAHSSSGLTATSAVDDLEINNRNIQLVNDVANMLDVNIGPKTTQPEPDSELTVYSEPDNYSEMADDEESSAASSRGYSTASTTASSAISRDNSVVSQASSAVSRASSIPNQERAMRQLVELISSYMSSAIAAVNTGATSASAAVQPYMSEVATLIRDITTRARVKIGEIDVSETLGELLGALKEMVQSDNTKIAVKSGLGALAIWGMRQVTLANLDALILAAIGIYELSKDERLIQFANKVLEIQANINSKSMLISGLSSEIGIANEISIINKTELKVLNDDINETIEQLKNAVQAKPADPTSVAQLKAHLADLIQQRKNLYTPAIEEEHKAGGRGFRKTRKMKKGGKRASTRRTKRRQSGGKRASTRRTKRRQSGGKRAYKQKSRKN